MPDIFDADAVQKEEEKNPAVSVEEPSDTTTPLHHPPTPPTHPPKHVLAHSENHYHALASFCQHPDGMHFTTQEADENIILFLRAHFATNVSWITLTIFFAFLPMVFVILLPQLSPTTLFSFIPSSYVLVLLCFYYLILFAYAFVNFITWLYNIFFVTTKRIVDIDFSNIVFHQLGATKKELIEDVHFDQVGFIPTLLDFGTVFVSTASEVPIFEANNVPHPSIAVNAIEQLIGRKA